MKNKASTSKKTLKMGPMKAIWDDSESEFEEVDTASMCFMTQGDHASKVQSPLLDDAEISFEVMTLDFREVMKKYECLRFKHLN